MNCSSRVNSQLHRPARSCSAASATRSSVSISCLPPKPPPTRSQNTRTLSGRDRTGRTACPRVRNGIWLLVRTLSTPSASMPGDRAVRLQMARAGRAGCIDVPSWTTSASAKPASTSPMLAVRLRPRVALRIADAAFRPLVVQDAARRGAWPLRGRRPPAAPRSRPRAAGSPPRRRPRCRRPRRRPAGRRTAPRRRARRCRRGRRAKSSWRGGGEQPLRRVLVGEDGDARPAPPAPRCLSIARMRACACGERSTFRCSSPSIGDVEGVARLRR